MRLVDDASIRVMRRMIEGRANVNGVGEVPANQFAEADEVVQLLIERPVKLGAWAGVVQGHE